MADSSGGFTTRQFVKVSVAFVVLTTGLIIAPLVVVANRAIADDGNPEVIFAVMFVVAMLVPLAGVRPARPWRSLAHVQVGAAVVACLTLLVFRPESSGMYGLPIAAAAAATLVTSIVRTIRIARADARRQG